MKGDKQTKWVTKTQGETSMKIIERTTFWKNGKWHERVVVRDENKPRKKKARDQEREVLAVR